MVGIININGVIGSDVMLTDVISQVKSQQEATSLIVNINSEGGNVDEGFNIYNYIKSLGLPVKTIGSGVVASIATVIFMAGSKREIKKGTIFMIHYPMIEQLTNVTSEKLDSYSKELKRYEKILVDFYVETTGLEKEAIEPMLNNETFLEYKDLYNLGFVTDKTPIKVQAISNINNNSKTKTMDSKKEREVGSKILDMVKNFLGKTEIKDKVLLDANQNEVVFPDVAEEDAISVGDEATINGEPAIGEVVLADGRTVTFEAGVVTEISDDSQEDGADQSDEQPVDESEIKKVNDRIDKLAEVVESFAEFANEVKDEKKQVEKERDEAVDIINKIEKMQSKIVGEKKKTRKSNKETEMEDENPLSGAIKNLN